MKAFFPSTAVKKGHPQYRVESIYQGKYGICCTFFIAYLTV